MKSPSFRYIDKTFGRPYQLFPFGDQGQKTREFLELIDGVKVFLMTYGVACFQTAESTDVLRFPYYTDAYQHKLKNKILSRPSDMRLVAERNRDIAAGAEYEKKARQAEEDLETLNDRKKFLAMVLDKMEAVLDRMEEELSREDRLGPWLCGPAFGAADISLTVLLLRLHQLGLDERLWKGGARPGLAVYQELAFKRPSVEKATGWRKNEGQEMSVRQLGQQSRAAVANGGGGDGGGAAGDDGGAAALDAAKVGLGAVLAIGGIYACRKLFLKK